ncbi:class I SAM-dependent methyltransferase [Solirubrobacter ginsenosidimutans]|uniref:Class I SAM-dependent methyltransferase n=1 Tax=Solirubrobacter ginsenosidimutans TaxID=490573 RepID=A0A9X3MN82_9ACTN|nr:methyltransferase domain-containing protein [Solirubrobacter ginsenosidimutans]MDA0158726.1 class I SAM-dependent methyltransferase [Solirubrobacter ginsenosidimutans]
MPHGHHGAFELERIAAALEVEGQLTSGLTSEAIALCADRFATTGDTVRRVIDLGCGPGVGTALLAERFESATVVAVDGSAAMLARAEAIAARLGVADRVETRALDLDGDDLQALGTFDLAWAAMAIHHARDEVATLTNLRQLLLPHGLVCVLEREDATIVRLADDLGRPGIWDRLQAARRGRVSPSLPGASNAERYPAMLAAAGLEVVVSDTLSDTVTAPDDAPTHAFLRAQLRGSLRDLVGVADPADLDALRACVEATPVHPDGRWDGAAVTSSRKRFIARPARSRLPQACLGNGDASASLPTSLSSAGPSPSPSGTPQA